MEDIVNNFSRVEYLTIFGTFVYGYVSTRFLYGWGSMISRRRNITFSKEHLLWTILLFIVLIDVWWSSWLKSEMIAIHRLYFFISLASPVVLYVFSVIFFPEFKTVNFDMIKYFNGVRSLNYILFGCLCVSFFLNDYFLELSPWQDYAMNGVAFAVVLAGFLIKRKEVDRAILSLAFVLVIIHLFTRQQYTFNYASIENFSVTEYLTIFSAFIFGAVAAVFLSGWAEMLQRSGIRHWNREHTLWTLFAFGLLVDVWWDQWFHEESISVDIWKFMLSLSTPTIFYFLAVVFFPHTQQEGHNVNAFYESNRKVIFALVGLILAADLVMSVVLENDTFYSVTNMLRLSGVGLAVIASTVNNHTLHRAFLAAGWLLLLLHIILEG